jgi:hypothetical protein
MSEEQYYLFMTTVSISAIVVLFALFVTAIIFSTHTGV